uniref:RAB11 family interacting protein 5b (class I) n=1 Tax=Hippocampus comes TaxID=109280 RepID=A0A3Q3DUQ6_HIPCM
MMSLIDLDDEQRWVPTHVNVTVLCARGLRTKSKHGSRYLYAVVQVGKDKYTTGLVDKAEVPVWSEECCFELLPGILEEEIGGGGGRGAYPPGSADLVLTIMHRVLIGLDVFLGQTVIPLDRLFREGACPRDQWFKLHSKAGRKPKERGELQLTVQFTRNNMTASMFDLTAKDGRRSAFGKLKDRVTGRKRPDVESSSAIVPDVEATEEKRSVMKDFFKGKLRKSSDTRSCSSLASESSTSSMASDTPGPPPALGLLSDLPSSPIYTTNGPRDCKSTFVPLSAVLTSRNAANILTHKRAFSDEASKITESDPRTNPNMESVRCQQSISQSKSSVCINGSHVYDSEPSIPKSAGALPSKLVLLEKCSPLSRSLQNLPKRSEDKGTLAEGRRWSFDKMKKEGKEEEKETPPAETRGHSEQAAKPSAADSSDKGWKPHPVKPLSQPEKKESRSVLDKLKSTISPARSVFLSCPPDKSSVPPQEPTEDRSALYEHLTNMELISLLLQQDMDMNKQQVRDLEDYIDNLLLRIMEQTPTLLQVRSRHK